MNTCRMIRLGAGSRFELTTSALQERHSIRLSYSGRKPKRSPIAVGHSAARPPHILILSGRLGFVLQRFGFRSLCCGEL